MPRICIGIDPGDNTGVAVWNVQGQEFSRLCTLPLHRALTLVRELWDAFEGPAGDFLVIFEDARQRTFFERERNASEYRGKLMGAGAAKRDAKIWEEFLTDYNIPFRAVKPSAGRTKWSADYFARVTGYAGRTSNHARDAAVLVFQMR